MSQTLKIILLLLTFLPLILGRILEPIFSSYPYGEATVDTSWVFAVLKLHPIQDFLADAIPLLILLPIAGFGIYNIFRSGPKQDRSRLVLIFTLLAIFWLILFIPMVFLWN